MKVPEISTYAGFILSELRGVWVAFSATVSSLLGMSTKPRFSVIRPLEREAERNVEVM